MRRFGAPAAAGLCLLIYLPVAIGILRSGNNPDDWRFLAGREIDFAAVHGRWATEIGHNILFGGRFLTAVHLVMVFVALFLVSVMIARRAVPRDWFAAATVVLFLAGAHHAYLTDVLHYQSLAGWFSIGLACSVAAMALIYPGTGARSWLKIGLLHLTAAQLLALSIGFYQSFALLGLLLPAVALLRIDAVSDRDAISYCFRALAVCALGAVLYSVELKLILLALGQEAQPRFTSSGLEVVLAKLPHYPGLMRRLLAGGNAGLVPPYRTLLLLGSLAVMGLAILAAAARFVGRPGSRAGRRELATVRCLVGGLGAVGLLPGLFWFAYPEDYLPGRSAGFLGFVVAGVALAAAAALAGSWSRARTGALAAGWGIAALYGLVGAVASHQMWSVFGATSDRDIALATAIEARARQELGDGARSAPIRLVGGVTYDDLRFGWFSPPSSLHPGIDLTSIFEVLFGADGPTGSMAASPRPCPAFPAEGSLFVSDGAVHVCLEARGAFPEFASCEAIGRLRAQVCFAPEMTVLRAPDCESIASKEGRLEVAVFNEDGSRSQTIRFHSQKQAFPVGEWCYRFAGPAAPNRGRIIVTWLEGTGETRWREDL